MVTEYTYDEDNILTGSLKDKDVQCDYTYNNYKIVILETKCYKTINDKEYIQLKWNREVLETNRAKQYKLISVKLIERENYKYSVYYRSKIPVKYLIYF
ncbi:hypothetical protein [uncultured Apibacter sp.]|uniref:hypothetical protein n=1 Tax=uncultured Apibacter sp. TaxID=1778616 RepID=UPI0025DECE03|nr:hypothetical protein [uncultured Apibacter sp.]